MSIEPRLSLSFPLAVARESGLTDAKIVRLIGDKNGSALIAPADGDVRPEHLVRQVHRIRFHDDVANLEH